MRLLGFVSLLFLPIICAFRLNILKYNKKRVIIVSQANQQEPFEDIPTSWEKRDSSWLMDSNSIEYVVGNGNIFSSLEVLGLNISSEISSRNIIPYHIVGGNDLFCNRELNMKQIEAIGFDMGM